MQRNRILAAIAAAATMAFASAAPAIGDGGAKTQIKVTKLKASGAAGKITSNESKCEGKGRRVQFFRLDGYISVKIQKTMTESNGSWKIKRDLKPGRYFAKVDSSPGCRYDNSKNYRLK
jgi:hypothetical protein